MNIAFENIKRVYFIGIGGIGMSALARYFSAHGKKVSGYDKTETQLTRELQAEGIDIHFSDDPALADQQADVVIYTPAIPKDHRELNFFHTTNIPLIKRSEALGIISRAARTVAVAGSHGKTTVSSMMAHIFHEARLPFTAFLGGIASNYQSNYLSLGHEWVLVEADEFDRSFHRLSPDIALITSVDTDHLDIYGSRENIVEAFVEFCAKIRPGGSLIAHESVDAFERMPADHKYRYGRMEESDFHLIRRMVEDGHYRFEMSSPKGILRFELGIGGIHNVENAIAAVSVALQIGISPEVIQRALISFRGVRRRFDKQFDANGKVYIDDYAHHPREIDALRSSVRELYPSKKVLAVFQPHLFSRSRDLAAEFAESLSLFDEVILLPIYPAREKPMEGVTSSIIADKIQRIPTQILPKEEVLDYLKNADFDLLLTIGAGDIDTLVHPITQWLNKR